VFQHSGARPFGIKIASFYLIITKEWWEINENFLQILTEFSGLRTIKETMPEWKGLDTRNDDRT
jgi:hypothetical protein